MDKIWKKYTDFFPSECQYYLTLHEYQGKRLFKAFVYDPKEGSWIWDRKRIPQVLCWYDLPFDYYCPCQGQENVPPVPEEFR